MDHTVQPYSRQGLTKALYTNDFAASLKPYMAQLNIVKLSKQLFDNDLSSLIHKLSQNLRALSST